MRGGVKLCGTAAVRPGVPLRLGPPSLPPLSMYNVAGELCRNGTLGTRKVAMPDGSFDDDALEYPASAGGFKIRTGATTQFSSTTPLKTCPVGAIGEQL